MWSMTNSMFFRAGIKDLIRPAGIGGQVRGLHRFWYPDDFNVILTGSILYIHQLVFYPFSVLQLNLLCINDVTDRGGNADDVSFNMGDSVFYCIYAVAKLCMTDNMSA